MATYIKYEFEDDLTLLVASLGEERRGGITQSSIGSRGPAGVEANYTIKLK